MVNCLCKKQTMSIEEFLKLDCNNTETFITKIMKNDKLKKIAIMGLGTVLYATKVLAATDGKGIDALGFKFLGLIRHWAYWILLVMCIVEVVRAGISNDNKKVLGIILKFLIIFGSMYLVPELFDAIKNAF